LPNSLRLNPIKAVATLLLVFLFVQIPLTQNTDDKTHINVYHILLLTLPFLYVPSLKHFRVNMATIFIVVLTLTTIFAAPAYGAGLRSTQLVFVVMAFFMGSMYGRKFDDQDWTKIFSIVFVCTVIFVILRDIAFAGQLAAIYTRTGYAENMLYLSTGGRNIEASLLVMLSILLLGTRFYFPSVMLALLTSGMMQSRAGLIGTAISLWIFLWRTRKTKLYYLNLALGMALLVLVAALIFTSVVDIPVLDRFNLKSETALEENGVGRLALWHYAGVALHKNLLGYGIGNGVPVMEKLSGIDFVENNVHNVYLQFLLEGGVQSLVAYLIMIVAILAKRATTRIQRNVKAYLICYLVLSTIQFNGSEAYLWFFIGAFFAFPTWSAQEESDPPVTSGRRGLPTAQALPHADGDNHKSDSLALIHSQEPR